MSRLSGVFGRVPFLEVAVLLALFPLLGPVRVAAANTSRSTYIPYDNLWGGPPVYRWIAWDGVHQQLFVAQTHLDRLDVLSTTDYHLIRSISVPSPASVDISPDGSTLAVATSSEHILFFSTATFVKTNDLAFPSAALGVSAFVYTANGNAFLRGEAGLSTGGGVTAFWDHAANSFSTQTYGGAPGPSRWLDDGPISRSGDYTRVIMGDDTSEGTVQIIDGTTGEILQQISLGGYIFGVAANKDASRYAVCVAPAGIAQSLLVFDNSLNQLFQEQTDCERMAFSADGQTLYSESESGSNSVTQAIDMTSMAIRAITDNYTSPQNYGAYWQDADGTGMVYGAVSMPSPSSNGTAFVAVDTTAAATPALPAPNDPVAILHVIDNIGSAQGGDKIRILCTGIDNVPLSGVQVGIGGTAANVISIEPSSPPTSLPWLRIATVKTPPGAPGIYDVTLTANGTTSTAAGAFQYASETTTFPFATSPSFLLYDNLRQKLYAAHGNQVEVIDPVAGKVLTPLVPVAGQQPNSQFAGLSLSPDNNRLYIADAGANLIYMLDLANPGAGATINPATALGLSTPLSPTRVFETTGGALVGSDSGGNLFTIDPASGTGSWITDSLGNRVMGTAWGETAGGDKVLVSGGGVISSEVGVWDAVHSEYTPSADAVSGLGETQGIEEAAINSDGTVIAAGGSTPGIQHLDPEFVDTDLNATGYLEQHFDAVVPTGTPSFFFDPSGALLYKAGSTPVGGSVEIDDVHQWEPAATVVFPEPFITSYSPFVNHMLATDSTGQYLFGVTHSGVTMMVLNRVPLSIGNVQPPFGQAAGGQGVTVRGIGFQPGAVVSFDSSTVATNFVDSNTLTVAAPSLATGWHDVSVRNLNGVSYTAPALYEVVNSGTAAILTGFFPSSVTVQSNIPGFDTTAEVTLLGNGFDPSDTVEIGGQPISSSFVDAGHIQATIPADLTGQTGSLSFSVASDYSGASNTLALPMVNPVPVIVSLSPTTEVLGSNGGALSVYGTDFVSGSLIEWNGQPLSGTLMNGGETTSGLELLTVSIPASLLAAGGPATVTVVNPAPGGGTSNAIAMDVSAAHAAVTWPAALDFGNVLINISATQSLHPVNTGSAPYTLTSFSVTPGDFTVSAPQCSSIPVGGVCPLQIQFLPTASGPASATLTITDNVAGSPHTIALTGTGTQTLLPQVTITSIDALDQTVSARINGKAVVGGSDVPATAWIEYGTDPTLATYTTSPSWTFTGDQIINGTLTGLTPATQYAVRLAVQSPGGTGRSAISILSTEPASPAVAFALAAGGSSSATVTAGQTAMYSLMANDGGNGYTGTVTLSCTGAPAGATCAASPSSLSIAVNPTPFTVSVTTTAASSSATLRGDDTHLGLVFASILGAMLIPTRRWRRGLQLLLCVGFLLCWISACGGGSTSTSPPPPTMTATPPGTYSITVTGTTQGAQTSQLLQLTVQ